MAEVLELKGLADARAGSAAEVLERGGLVLFPTLPFALKAGEAGLIDAGVLSGKSKNISLDPATGKVRGSSLEGERLQAMGAMVARFSARADEMLRVLTPGYGLHLQKRRTSFRPGAIETRALSPRKDDKRLHVDAFPANPVQGRRILRVFTNANPSGEARLWSVGDEGFELFAERFRSKLKPKAAGPWRERLGLTKGPRTAYDAAMLQLHDVGKFDETWQKDASRTALSFPPGASWAVYTDSVLHAALAGQHAFEQTYLMPISGMVDERRSPLRILERLTGRPLI